MVWRCRQGTRGRVSDRLRALPAMQARRTRVARAARRLEGFCAAENAGAEKVGGTNSSRAPVLGQPSRHRGDRWCFPCATDTHSHGYHEQRRYWWLGESAKKYSDNFQR